jgi:hypothetical protein
MAKTENVNFPVWGAMQNGVQLDNNSYMALYIGDQLSVDEVGDKYSITAIVSPDSLSTAGLIFALTPSLLGAGTFPLALTDGYILGAGFRAVDSDLFLEVASDPKALGLYDSTSRLPISSVTGKEDPFATGKPIHICVTMEVTEITGNEITGVSMSLYLNGDVQVQNSTSPSGWIKTAGNPDFLLMQKDMIIGAVKVHDYLLTAEQIRQDYLIASREDFVGYTDITSVTISGVVEEEFNNTFGIPNLLSMSSNTEGTFTVGDARAVSSFISDPITGLPTAGDANWGAYITLGVEAHATKYPLDRFYVDPTVAVDGSVICLANFDPTTVFGTVPTSTEEIFISGVIGGEHGWSSYNGYHTISTVALSPYYIISFSTAWSGISSEIRYRDLAGDAQILLDYPKSFDFSAEVPGTDLSPETTFSTNRLAEEYVVRVRGVAKSGRTSRWLQGSSLAQANVGAPNAIHVRLLPASDPLTILGFFDFTLDLLGVTDPTFHVETNLSHVEFVTCHADTDRDSATQSPGGDLLDVRYTRTSVVPLSGPPDIYGISAATVQIPITGTGDYYAWGRLVNTAGVASDWFPKDSGLSADRGYPANTATPIGLGPFRIESGSATNLVPDAESTETSVDTTTSDPEGPGSSGSGGVFTSIP